MRFDPVDGSKPTQSTVKTGTLAAPPQQNPQREGFRFDGWTYDGQPFDFQTPILQDTTLKAQWTKATDWKLSPDHGPATGARLTINPPDRQEPQFASIQAAGNQILGLTGDGRIYTWTQDNTPMQVPFPTQAPDGFRYLQAAAGSRWHAALGSDQHIYTWNSQQSVPIIIDTGRNTEFTSININDDRLLAVDRQGQVHTYQADQNPNSKPAEQAAHSLPRQAQAVLAAASVDRTLIVDSDGQVWVWDTSNPGKAKTTRIKQAPDMHITQAQTLSQGFLLLDAEGQAYYLANSTTSSAAISLPKGMKASRITSNDSQTSIVDKNGHVWAWRLGSKLMRANNRDHQYMQAAVADSWITAIDRQGDIFTWSMVPQSNPGRPAKLNTTQAPTLQSASMDGRPLKLTRKNDSWQADLPARKPGSALITITGRQYHQPFTRSLDYTIDQKLLRDAQQGSTHTVTFNTAGGSQAPEPQQVSYPYGRVQRPSPDPAREGYRFCGWFIGEVTYDFSRPVKNNLALTAHWTSKSRNNKWSISPDRGIQLGRQRTTVTPPDNISRDIRFSQVSVGRDSSYGFSLAVGSDGNAYAWGDNTYGQLGDGTQTSWTTPVMVRKPAGVPADFTYVQVSAGDRHSLALGSDGYAYAWGDNNYGQLGNNTGSPSPVPVRVRDPDNPNNASQGLQAIQVSAGYEYSLALGSDGNAYAWGDNTYGQLGDGTQTSWTTPVMVRKPAGVPADFTYVQVSAGDRHSLALGSDGYAYAWGDNNYGQLGNNTGSPSPVPVRVRDPDNPNNASQGLQAIQVSAGYEYSLALGSDGNAYAWGYNNHGKLGNNNLKNTYVPVHVRDPNSPTDANKGLQATQISAGGEHSLALGSDGYAYAWGYNTYGQLGNNSSYNYSAVPVRVRDPASPTDTSKGLQAVEVSAGGWHSLAIGSDGNTEAWGINSNGQLGDGTTNDKWTPVSVVSNLQPMITGVNFDSNAGTNLTRGDGSSVSVLTPAHAPGTVTVSVDYTLGGAPQTPDTSLKYTYLPAGVLPKAGGEGILLALATGMTGMGGVLASRRHRKEQNSLSHASYE